MQIPDSSTDDCDAICRLFDNNKVFPLVEDQHRRKRLSERVLNCKRILSFQSFFDDFRYIRPCFESLSILLPERSWRKDKSFQQVFEHNWIRNTQHDNGKHDFLRCYIELWLFAMREFPSLSSSKTSMPLQDKAWTNKLIRPRLTVSKKEVEFAYNASLLGFDTCEIESIKRMHPSGIQQFGPNRLPPEYSCDDRPLPQTARSNRPSVDSYQEDKDYLHPIYMIHASPARKKRYATRIAVTKDIVQCCWTDTERWVASQRRSQQGRFPVRTTNTDGIPRDTTHLRSDSKVVKPLKIKMPQRRSFNPHLYNRNPNHNSYQTLIRKLEVNPLPAGMEFSEAFVKMQGRREESNALQTTTAAKTKPDHESSVANSKDPITEALRLLENPDLGIGEATGSSLGAQNHMDGQEECDYRMDLDLSEVADSRSLEVMPLNMAIRRGLDEDCDKSRASSIYSSYGPTVEDSQDIAAVLHNDASSVRTLIDVGATNGQASNRHLQKSQQGGDHPGGKVHPRDVERIPKNSTQSALQGESSASHSISIEDIHKDPGIPTATESSPETVRAPLDPYYPIREGSEAGHQIDEANELLNDTSSVEVSTHDGPADGQGPYRPFESHGDVSNAHDSASGRKGVPPSISKRSAIRGDDELHKREDTHDTTIRNAERYRSGDSSVKLNSDGKKATGAELTKGLGEVKPSEKDKPNRATELPFIPNGTMPFGTSNEDGTLSVKDGVREEVLGKRKRFDPNEGYKDKRIMQDPGKSPGSVKSDESL
jgi:hypothetical protein